MVGGGGIGGGGMYLSGQSSFPIPVKLTPTGISSEI